MIFMNSAYRKANLILTATLTGIIIFSGCTKKEVKKVEKQESEVITQNNIPDEPSTNGLGIPDSKYEQIIPKSLVTTGNNYMVKQVLQKMKAGEEVIYAAIGGSVTEGAGPASYKEGYVYQFKDLFIQKYAADQSKVKFIPAGIGGTPSAMGVVRYQKDVVAPAGRDPDLLIIEFAVNDWLECSKTRAIEYIVRNALEHNTAVIMLYGAATYQNQQGQIKPVADFYKLPQVSISDALLYSGVNQEKNSKVYYSDYVHPTRYGHTFMARCLMNLIDTIDLQPMDEKAELPAGYKNANAFTNFFTVSAATTDKNVNIQSGTFCTKDEAIQAYSHGGKCFPENWAKPAGDSSSTSENLPFTMSLECKSLIMVYKNADNNNFGKAEVYIDGVLKNTYAGHEEGGWNNCQVVMIIDEQQSEQHTVEIKMAAGDENKAFTILAFGYSK